MFAYVQANVTQRSVVAFQHLVLLLLYITTAPGRNLFSKWNSEGFHHTRTIRIVFRCNELFLWQSFIIRLNINTKRNRHFYQTALLEIQADNFNIGPNLKLQLGDKFHLNSPCVISHDSQSKSAVEKGILSSTHSPE